MNRLPSVIITCLWSIAVAAYPGSGNAAEPADSNASADEPAELGTVVVTASRREQDAGDVSASVSRVDADTLSQLDAQHPNELFSRFPGTWISRGSGQEHLTAIRSPILTGAGACGAFLFLEDGIPVRPAGFCNVNQLFEINTEQARAIEVLRGPGSAVHGSNAVHGIINVLPQQPGTGIGKVKLSVGEYSFRRLQFVSANEHSFSANGVVESADSIQHDAGHEQAKLNLGWNGATWRAHLAATTLDQDTAGFIIGEDAYRDPALKRSNPNPEAYRQADSLRGWAVITPNVTGNYELELRPYVRYSDMDFLQHFLPGKPLEQNGQSSVGLIAGFSGTTTALDWQTGIDLEWADGWLRQSQEDAITDGSDFLRETRPAGQHYDYDVTQAAVSPWLQLEHDITDTTSVSGGLRVDAIRYDYDNRMRDGNTRDDGSECGFGGCLYNRPADRDDEFVTTSPRLGLHHRLSENVTTYLQLARGFRVPQATELYRLQRGQDVADLDAVRIDNVELGWRGNHDRMNYSLAVFAMKKRNAIFRDADGFNVSSARTRHRGIETDLKWQLSTGLSVHAAASWTEHTYAFDYRPVNGETFSNGDDIDSAPRTLANITASWRPHDAHMLELEWRHTGTYYLDAENSERYPGHDLWHARWHWQLDNTTLNVRIDNLLDSDYAERADYAFGNHRYFPGWPRRVTIGLAYDF
jgi:outer membrane receptor protein involved in Fe transport